MEELLTHPAVQGGVAPLAAGLIAAVVLAPLRLSGLAVVAGFAVCVQLTSGFQFTPLTATRKAVLIVLAAAATGPILDLVLKPTKIGIFLITVLAGAAPVWAFWTVLSQKSAAEAWLLGATMAVAATLLVGFALVRLAADSVRAGAAALGGGLGAGVAAILGASISYGLLGVAIAAAAGGFLLPQMLRGKRSDAGATFALPAMLGIALVAAGAMMLAQTPWYSVLALALVGVAAAVPLPSAWPLAVQAIVASLSASAVAVVACGLAYAATRS